MTTMNALPEGLIHVLHELFNLSEEPLRIDSEESLLIFLELYVPGFREWGTAKGSKSVAVLLKEFREHECVLSVIEYQGTKYILRDIETATLYVTANVHQPTLLNPRHISKKWLREYHLEGNEAVRRTYRNSMSEKRNLVHETFLQAAIRALQQELTLHPSPEHLISPHLFPMSDYPMVQDIKEMSVCERALPSLPDVRWTKRYPGTLTRNRLEHFIWAMPDEYFNPAGYHEPKTNHYFEWVPVDENDMSYPVKVNG